MVTSLPKVEIIIIAIIFFVLIIGLIVFYMIKIDSESAKPTATGQKSNLSQQVSQNKIIAPPAQPVKLVFIHHSTGENWLKDNNGGFGAALRDNNYFVSDTNYGWGPVSAEGSVPIGSLTDIGHWWLWFRGPQSSEIMTALYNESGQHASYSRLLNDPGGKNRIIMFKSCYPNSNLKGDPNDIVPPIDLNPLRGMASDSAFHTAGNAKGIYADLLDYFRQHQDTLFIVITAPPVSDTQFADNARTFNQWLVNEWLTDYPYNNVAVFDLYNVLTTNAGTTRTNDLNKETGNHHRWWGNTLQHVVDRKVSRNTTAYASGFTDDHPNRAGNQKATSEFIPFLNFAYNRWYEK
jgi:hypothetical protein